MFEYTMAQENYFYEKQDFIDEAIKKITCVVMQPAANELIKLLVDGWGCDLKGYAEIMNIINLEDIHIAALSDDDSWYKLELEKLYEVY